MLPLHSESGYAPRSDAIRAADGGRKVGAFLDAGADDGLNFVFIEHLAGQEGFGELGELRGVLLEGALGAGLRRREESWRLLRR